MSSLAGLLLGYTILVIGNSLLTTLVSLHLVYDSVSPITVGLVQSCYYAGFMLGALVVGRPIARIGHHRAFVGFGALGALAPLGQLFFSAPAAWALLRLITGLCMVGIFTAIESGVNAAVDNQRRGRAFATYLVLSYLGASAGQILLSGDNLAGSMQWVLVNSLFVCALIPAALMDGWPASRRTPQSARTLAPGAADDAPLVPIAMPASSALPAMPARALPLLDGLRELWRIAPRNACACVAAGLLCSSFYTMTPIYLAGIGYDHRGISHIMGVALIGAFLAQRPIGWCSDQFERHRILFTVALITAAASTILTTVGLHWIVDLVVFIYVSLIFTLYGVVVSDVNDHIGQGQRVTTSAALLLTYSLGGMAGPTLASLCIRLFGARGLYLFTLAVTSTLAWLMRRRVAARP